MYVKINVRNDGDLDMTKQERERLKNEIAMKDVMTKKIGKWSKYALLAFLLTGAIAIWGFTGMNDAFMQVSDSTRTILKWVAVCIAVPTGIFSLMAFLSYRNSKKHVLGLIDRLQNKK